MDKDEEILFHTCSGFLCPAFVQSIEQVEERHQEGFHITIVVYSRSEPDGMTSFEMGTVTSLPLECGAELKTAIQAIITKYIGVKPN